MDTKSKPDSEEFLPSKPRETPMPLATSEEVSDELYEEQLRGHAQKFMPSAIDKLAELATSGPAAVQRQSAKDLIDYGRRVPKLELTQALTRDHNIVINLMSFGDSVYGKKVQSGEVNTDVIQAKHIEEEDVIDVEPVEEKEEPADPLLVRIKTFGT